MLMADGFLADTACIFIMTLFVSNVSATGDGPSSGYSSDLCIQADGNSERFSK